MFNLQDCKLQGYVLPDVKELHPVNLISLYVNVRDLARDVKGHYLL